MIDPQARRIESMQPIVHEISQVLDRHPPPDGYVVHMTGLPALRVDIVDTLQRDLLFLFPLAGAVFLCALTIIFRRASMAAVSVIAVVNGWRGPSR